MEKARERDTLRGRRASLLVWPERVAYRASKAASLLFTWYRKFSTDSTFSDSMGITPSYRAYTHTQRTLLRADGRTKPIDCSSNKPASSHLDLHYSIQYSSACGQRIFRESDRINSPTCQSSASGSPLYELAITTFPPALFLSRSLKICQIINVCFWLIKASRINSTFFFAKSHGCSGPRDF